MPLSEYEIEYRMKVTGTVTVEAENADDALRAAEQELDITAASWEDFDGEIISSVSLDDDEEDEDEDDPFADISTTALAKELSRRLAAREA